MRGDGAWLITLILRAPVSTCFPLYRCICYMCVCICVCVYSCVLFSIRVESDRSGRRDLTVSSSCRTMKNRLILSQVSIFLCIYEYMYIHKYIYLYLYIYLFPYIYKYIYNPSPTVACVYYSPFSRSHNFAHHPYVCFGVLYPLLSPVSLLFLPIILVSRFFPFFILSTRLLGPVRTSNTAQHTRE